MTTPNTATYEQGAGSYQVTSGISEEIKLELVKYTAKTLMPKLPYHNFRHAQDVCNAASFYAYLENIDQYQKFLLKTAALLHDETVVPGKTDNEEKSADFARDYLPAIGYSYAEAEHVADLILATKMPQKPKNLLEKIICDADLDNLGRDDFFERGEEMKIENKYSGNNNGKWYQMQMQFLKSHQYHTEAAKKVRDEGKLRNIQKIDELLAQEK